MYINNLQTNTSHPIPSHPLQEDLLQISQTTSRADRGRFFFCSPSCSAGQRKSHTCFMWTRDAWNPHVPSTNLPGKTLGSLEGLQRQRERRWGTKKRKITIGLGRVTVRGTLGLNHSRRVSRKRPRFLLLLPPRHPADLGSWCRTRGFFVFFSLLTVQDRTSRKADDGGIVKLQYLPLLPYFRAVTVGDSHGLNGCRSKAIHAMRGGVRIFIVSYLPIVRDDWCDVLVETLCLDCSCLFQTLKRLGVEPRAIHKLLHFLRSYLGHAHLFNLYNWGLVTLAWLAPYVAAYILSYGTIYEKMSRCSGYTCHKGWSRALKRSNLLQVSSCIGFLRRPKKAMLHKWEKHHFQWIWDQVVWDSQVPKTLRLISSIDIHYYGRSIL